MITNNAATHSQGGTSRCRFCGAVIDSSFLSCPGCGATVGRSQKPTNSGWTELPPIKDMARLRVGSSTCQIEGMYVPVADFNLAAGDSVYFAHHVLLWKDPQVEIKRMPLAGAITRMMAGLPVVMTEAHGPGHIAFSRDEPGEMIALPLEAGQSIDVCEHLLVAATSNINYSSVDSGVWFSTAGRNNETEYHYPVGRYIDHFRATEQPGLILLHASGNVFVRQLSEGQTLFIKPKALVYKERTVRMALDVRYPTGYYATSHRLLWLHLTGPGRVAIQSAYEPVEDDGGNINSYSAPMPSYRASRPAGMAWSSVVSAPANRSTDPIRVDPRHARLAKMATEAMVNGQIPPQLMQRLLDTAEAEGLSEYDVRLIVKHVQSHGA